jgi:hypothetical protein
MPGQGKGKRQVSAVGYSHEVPLGCAGVSRNLRMVMCLLDKGELLAVKSVLTLVLTIVRSVSASLNNPCMGHRK